MEKFIRLGNLLVVLLALISFTHSQFFDPILDDKSYLDSMEVDVQAEVALTSRALIREARLVQAATRDYIGAKLKENVFRALRTLAEKEMAKAPVPIRSPRQDGEDESGGGAAAASAGEASESGGGGSESGGGGSDTAEAAEAATTELNGLATAVKINQNVFKFLGDTFKIIFQGLGGKARKLRSNFYVDEAASLMNEPFADQLLGLVGLMANEAQSNVYQTQGKYAFATSKVHRALFHQGLERANSKYASSVVQDNIDVEIPDLSRFNVDGFVATFKKSVEEVQMPKDLFYGVREAYKFLDTMTVLNGQFRPT
jgi:hypothetical protein